MEELSLFLTSDKELTIIIDIKNYVMEVDMKIPQLNIVSHHE